MKVKDLLKQLEGKEDFEIFLSEKVESDIWPTFEKIDIEICDIGYSDKIIVLDKVEHM